MSKTLNSSEEVLPPRSSDGQIYGRLLTYVAPYWPAFIFSVIGFTLYTISNVGFVQLIAYIVDSLGGNDPLVNSKVADVMRGIFGDGDQLNRTVIPMAIILMVFVRGLGTFIGNYFITYIGTTLVHTLRVQLFDRMLVLPSSYFDNNTMGHLVAKVTFHVTQVTGAATNAVTVLIREGFTVMGYMGYLLYLNWKLTLIFFAIAPVIGILVSFAGKRFRRISERIQSSMGDVTHVASEAVQGYREVRTFGGTEYERERFGQVSQTNRRQSMKMVITSSISTPVVQLVVASALAGLVWLVLDPVLLANMSAGDVIAFITTGGLLAKPIRQLSEVNATVQRGLAAAGDIFDLFDEAVEVDEGEQSLSKVDGKLEFRDVSFSYQNTDKEVLSNISFTAKPGETIALVGRSGSGKSTLASLIAKFYQPTSGQILLDDVPIESLQLSNLRAHLALVSQDVTLFNDTVANNIAYGALRDADHALIAQAAEKAYALPFIEKLENGLDTLVGDDGVLLSGGQRQRLAIARAFLKDAPVLILDEATSALDSESERYIQSALEAVSEGRTTIVIAHRLSTIEKADRILVLDQGIIVEQGTHAALIACGGHYANLHNYQSDDQAQEPVVSPPLVHLNPVKLSSINNKWLSEESLVSAWYSNANWLQLLRPLSFLYRVITSIRRTRTKVVESSLPVVVVGNINVGGTGKSPLVAWLCAELIAKGFKPGIVSRGYGGTASAYPYLVNAASDPVDAGDEAIMLYRKTDSPVVVDPKRVNAVAYLAAETDCDVVISDDGLQHYKMARQFEIAVIDAEKGLGNGLCLPAGPLREPPSRLHEVNRVVANGERSLDLGVESYTMALMPKNLVHLLSQSKRDVHLDTKTVHAVAGIGNPSRFFSTLKDLGYEPIEHAFDDHHQFELTDISFGDSLPIIMTEKDAIKCRLLNPELVHDDIWYLDVEAEVKGPLLDEILQVLDHQVDAAQTKSQSK